MAFDPNTLRDVMRQWASGVTVVTTADGDTRAGATASSFTSVALEPPLVLVCLNRDIEVAQRIVETHHFAVSILAEGQADVSQQLAGGTQLPEGADKFYGVETFRASTGSPVLAHALAWLDCELQATHDGGTHYIFVGRVVAGGTHASHSQPLLYHNRAYRALAHD